MIKGIWRVSLLALSVCVVVLAIMLMTGTLQRLTADWRGGTQQREQTRARGEYRIAQYEHFYDLCAQVTAKEDQIDIQEIELKETTDEDRRGELRTNLTALRTARAEQISQYNADARKADTAGNFRASDLPYQLDVDEETSCTVEPS